MKIIVTGCRGQLGTEILKQLREGRSEIGPIPEKLLNATVLPVDLPELDISNYRMVDEFIRRNRPDVIINCAAYTNVDGCEVNHDAAFKANALGPRNLAQAAEKTGARLVHVSTDYVFSGRENGGIPQDEATIPGPISAYGSTNFRKYCITLEMILIKSGLSLNVYFYSTIHLSMFLVLLLKLIPIL